MVTALFPYPELNKAFVLKEAWETSITKDPEKKETLFDEYIDYIKYLGKSLPSKRKETINKYIELEFFILTGELKNKQDFELKERYNFFELVHTLINL